MDRKKFIKATGIGLGLALIPGMIQGKTLSAKNNNTKSKIVKDSEGNILNVIGDIQTHKLGGSDTGNQLT